jgi:uncharacterized protein
VAIVVSLASSHNDPDRATVAFVVANAAVASGQETSVFLSSDGAWLGGVGQAEKINEEGFAPLADLMSGFLQAGGRLLVCSPCAKKRGIGEDQLVPGAQIAGGATLVSLLVDGAQCVSY